MEQRNQVTLPFQKHVFPSLSALLHTPCYPNATPVITTEVLELAALHCERP